MQDEGETTGDGAADFPLDGDGRSARLDREISHVVLDPPPPGRRRVDATASAVEHGNVLLRRFRIVVEDIHDDAVAAPRGHLGIDHCFTSGSVSMTHRVRSLFYFRVRVKNPWG